ncbi:hypothetical protein GCM10011578_013220 [Streptomyces fuscichromogenes]|uniref:Uncharacterized protein n=1 Tax=Streptomyces fuscichromogenes TaxID=1324013 RepID=A0A917X8Y7_9ACTN|nr:hypothetical protein GCM10011578_013220 [Streptomyces fuscichromogenes]
MVDRVHDLPETTGAGAVSDRLTRSCFQAVITGSINAHRSSDKSLGQGRLRTGSEGGSNPLSGRCTTQGLAHTTRGNLPRRRTATSAQVRAAWIHTDRHGAEPASSGFTPLRRS